jgi:hypothetical protein
MSSALQPARVRDEGKLRELAAELGEEREYLADDGLHVVLAAGDDQRHDLVAQEVPVRDHLLVLDAVHALDHLVVEAARAAPADRRRDDDDVAQCTTPSYTCSIWSFESISVIEQGQVQARADFE